MPSLLHCVFVSLTLYTLSLAQSSCIASCQPGDILCQASCLQSPTPNSSLTEETTECVAQCDQGDGSPESVQKYSECTQACISMFMVSTSSSETTTMSQSSDTLTTTAKSDTWTGTATPEATPSSDSSIIQTRPGTTLQTSMSSSDAAGNSSASSTGPPSSPSPTAQGNKPPSLSAGAGAGIGIGALIFLIALGIAGFVFWRHRRSAKPPGADGANMYSDKEVRNDKTNIHMSEPWNRGVNEIYGTAVMGEEMEDSHGLKIARDREGRSELKT